LNTEDILGEPAKGRKKQFVLVYRALCLNSVKLLASPLSSRHNSTLFSTSRVAFIKSPTGSKPVPLGLGESHGHGSKPKNESIGECGPERQSRSKEVDIHGRDGPIPTSDYQVIDS